MGLELLDSLAGEKCWHVSAGGASAPSFLLVLGSNGKHLIAGPGTRLIQSDR